jgi:hypothetical protein
MTGKNPVRSCADVDESVLSYAEIKALAAGNPKIKEKMELDVQVAKLRAASANYRNTQYTLQDKLRKGLPSRMNALESKISKLRADIRLRDAHPGEHDEKKEKEKFPAMTLNGHVYEKRDEAGKELTALSKAYHDAEPIKIGEYRGFGMSLSYNPHFSVHQITLEGSEKYQVSMGDNASGNITRINNTLNGLDEKMKCVEEELKGCANQVRMAQEQLEKPFEGEHELTEKSARLAQLNLELNIDSHGGADDEDEMTLSEDEEYDYRAELEDAGIDESELFRRHKSDGDTEETAAEVGLELAEQGKNDELVREILAGAKLDIDETLVEESSQVPGENEQKESANITAIDSLTDAPAGKIMTSADLYGEKMDISNYGEFRYPKAAQLIDIHDPLGKNFDLLADTEAGEYHILLEGIVNAVLREHRIAEPSLNPYSSNDEYHFIRDCAMTIVCKELELPDFPEPRNVDGLSASESEALREKGAILAELTLYGHLPEKEREKLTAEMNVRYESDVAAINPAEERKALIAEAKRKLAEDGAMPIITDAMEGRAYEGEILEIGRAYAVQKIDEGRGIIHNLSYLKDFSKVINESGVPYLEISYDGEMNGKIGAPEATRQYIAASMSR